VPGWYGAANCFLGESSVSLQTSTSLTVSASLQAPGNIWIALVPGAPNGGAAARLLGNVTLIQQIGNAAVCAVHASSSDTLPVSVTLNKCEFSINQTFTVVLFASGPPTAGSLGVWQVVPFSTNSFCQNGGVLSTRALRFAVHFSIFFRFQFFT